MTLIELIIYICCNYILQFMFLSENVLLLSETSNIFLRFYDALQKNLSRLSETLHRSENQLLIHRGYITASHFVCICRFPTQRDFSTQSVCLWRHYHGFRKELHNKSCRMIHFNIVMINKPKPSTLWILHATKRYPPANLMGLFFTNRE